MPEVFNNNGSREFPRPEQIAAQRYTKKLIRQGFKKQALHIYQSVDGQTIYWRIRLKHPVTSEKWIRPLSCDEKGNFILKEPEFKQGKPLYRLPQLIQNPATIWVVEGEFCADHLAKLGINVTTSGSVDSVQVTDWSPLTGRNVIIWPDNDIAGIQYGNAVTQHLQALDCKVHWVDIAQLNLPPKADCIDWLAEHIGTTLQDVIALPLMPPPESERQKSVVSQETKTQPPNEDRSAFFTVNTKGVFYWAEEEPRWICSSMKIKALARDKLSENWGRLLEFADADGRVHTWAMPMEMLKGGGEELRGELLRLGLEIATGIKARNLLFEYIVTSKPEARACCVKRTGWHPPVFVFPHRTIGETTEMVIYQSENPTQDYQQSGSLEEWQRTIASLCAGNSRLVLAVSCAFAAMLLYPAGAESGGINLVGESSSGKTTALRVAASIYGAPDYMHRWRATTNGLEALAALRSDTLLVLDELAQVDAKEAGEIAYMLANGNGKARAARSGLARSRAEWRMLFLSAGEIGLAQHLEEAGKKAKAGQEVRLVDIPANANKGLGIFENLHDQSSAADFSRELLEATTKYYGIAAQVFLETLTAIPDIATLTTTIKKLCRQFMADNLPPKASGQVHRVCERFALIAAAGELASSYGITGWYEGEASRAAKQCFCDWINYRGGVENQEHTQVLSQVRRFFESHGESRFSELGSQNSRTLQRAGFKKTDPGNTSTIYYVLPQVFRHEICGGLDYRNAVRILLAEGCLLPDAYNNAYRREVLPGIGRARCYVFTAKLWE
ncbi:MAG TPA: DUF927 domain-containing protein [Gammaproteobacteria bacterium]|nr:DUF927 domain-containing protein [Gammaproteobacteria bacterium]